MSPESVRPSAERDARGNEEESEEAVRRKVRETEAVPSEREVEEHNVDHAVFRKWCPHCLKGRAEAYGRRAVSRDKTEAPRVSVDYVHMASEQDKEEEKGMPALVMKDQRTRLVTARVVPSKGLDAYAVGRLKKDVEQLGHRRIVTKSDNEPAILALKEAVRRESDVEIAVEEVPVGDHQANGSVESA